MPGEVRVHAEIGPWNFIVAGVATLLIALVSVSQQAVFVPEAKSSAAWVDANTLLISTDFGEGSLTTSGYPRVVKR